MSLKACEGSHLSIHIQNGHSLNCAFDRVSTFKGRENYKKGIQAQGITPSLSIKSDHDLSYIQRLDKKTCKPVQSHWIPFDYSNINPLPYTYESHIDFQRKRTFCSSINMTRKLEISAEF